MSIQQQLNSNYFAVTTDYEEVIPYLNNDSYDVSNTYRHNGLFDKYYITFKAF